MRNLPEEFELLPTLIAISSSRATTQELSDQYLELHHQLTVEGADPETIAAEYDRLSQQQLDQLADSLRSMNDQMQAIKDRLPKKLQTLCDMADVFQGTMNETLSELNTQQ